MASGNGRQGSEINALMRSPDWSTTAIVINYVDDNLSDQSSMLNFVEYNWGLESIPESFDQALAGADARAGIPFDLAGLFQFEAHKAPAFLESPATGQRLENE